MSEMSAMTAVIVASFSWAMVSALCAVASFCYARKSQRISEQHRLNSNEDKLTAILSELKELAGALRENRSRNMESALYDPKREHDRVFREMRERALSLVRQLPLKYREEIDGSLKELCGSKHSVVAVAHEKFLEVLEKTRNQILSEIAEERKLLKLSPLSWFRLR